MIADFILDLSGVFKDHKTHIWLSFVYSPEVKVIAGITNMNSTVFPRNKFFHLHVQIRNALVDYCHSPNRVKFNCRNFFVTFLSIKPILLIAPETNPITRHIFMT